MKKDKASLNGSQNFIIGNCRTDFIEFHLCLPSNAIKTDDQIRFEAKAIFIESIFNNKFIFLIFANDFRIYQRSI